MRSSFLKDMLPVLPNSFPYNEMLLRRILKLGDFALKTRSWHWAYRGPVLLYNSTSVARAPAEAYGFDPKKFPTRTIVGIANLVQDRELSDEEMVRLTCQFNNIKLSEDQIMHDAKKLGFLNPNRPEVQGMVWVEPLPIGFFFDDPHRFKEPVPFQWRPGPVRMTWAPIGPFRSQLRDFYSRQKERDTLIASL